ncbi:MAG: hypothetical protein JETCAE03_35890 [Ignavibacteriaceae bacterium]|jgi:hypothetical protein|nr:MAG: hypothetical protein JETCAE03_35890 [Ignavibacteriaceae bacterium]
MEFKELSLEDQIFILQQELQQAVWTVQFLHNCLTEPEHSKYSYPEQTVERVKKWIEILPPSYLCHHSVRHHNCLSCKINSEIRKRTKEIEDKLASTLQWFDAKMTSPQNNLNVIVRLKNGEIVETWQQFGEWPDGLEVVEWRFKE